MRTALLTLPIGEKNFLDGNAKRLRHYLSQFRFRKSVSLYVLVKPHMVQLPLVFRELTVKLHCQLIEAQVVLFSVSFNRVHGYLYQNAKALSTIIDKDFSSRGFSSTRSSTNHIPP